MRILFAFTGGRGHVEPLLPLAHAAEAASHTVAFAGRPEILPAVEALGFDAFATEPARTEPPKRIPLRELDPEREDRDFRDGFADRLARQRATSVHALGIEWRPDVVVCEETDFGSMVAAERLGVPHATVLVTAAGSFVRPELVSEPLNAVRAEHGLPIDSELGMLSRYLVLSPFPPSFHDPAFPLPATAHGFRSLTPGRAREGGTPTVYFTLGTVFNLESGDLFSRVLTGLRELPVDVVATVGSEIDPEELGPLPAHVRVERFVPQAEILPRCSAVVSHGGSGSVLGALAHGLPQVLIPMGADQPLNAARCEELGVGRVLDALAATPETVRKTVSEVLADPSYRTEAELIRDEIASLPGPEHAVTLLERLAGERRPLAHVRLRCDAPVVGVRIDSSLDGIDWGQAKADLAADDFDNGRSPEALRRSFEQSQHAAIARDGERVVGMARLLSDGVCNAYLVDVWTASSHRRQGIASKMMRLLIDAVPGQHVGLQTNDAQALYESLGFQPQPEFWSLVVGSWLDNGANR